MTTTPVRRPGWLLPVVRWRGQVNELARQTDRLAASAGTSCCDREVVEVAEDAAALSLTVAEWAVELARLAGEVQETAQELEAGRLSPADGGGWLAMELDRLGRHLDNDGEGR